MIALVTDSTAYISKKEARVYGIRVVPQVYTVNGSEHKETYIENHWEKNAELSFDRCGTRESGTGDFAATFRDLVKRGYDIICITISSRLSGTYYNAVEAKKQVKSGKIEILDSKLTAGGIYLLLKRARYLASLGMQMEEICGNVHKYIGRITVTFTVDEMRSLRNSRRLGYVRLSNEPMLNRRPLLTLARGTVTAEGTALGSSDLIKKMVKKIPSGTKNIILHYACPSLKVDKIYMILKKCFPASVVEKRIIGPVLSIQLGKSMIGVVWGGR